MVTLGALVILVAALMVRPDGLFAHAGDDGVSSLLRHLRASPAVAGGRAVRAERALSQFHNLQLATMAYYFVAVAGLTVLTGLNGQISLGHGALMAVGAYTTAKLLGEDGTGPPLALVLRRRRRWRARRRACWRAPPPRGCAGPTWRARRWRWPSGCPRSRCASPTSSAAPNGLTVVPPTPPLALGETFPLERWQACIACVGRAAHLCAAGQPRAQPARARLPGGARRRGRRRAGRAARRAHAGAGVRRQRRVRRAGGGLLVVVTSLAAPGAFPLALSVALLTGVILGGLGSLAGRGLGRGRAGARSRRWADDASQALGLPTDVQANLALAVYGAVLIGVMLAAPRGIQGALRRAHATNRGGACHEVLCGVSR